MQLKTKTCLTAGGSLIIYTDISAKPTFAQTDYHRRATLSLLCSKWEEVVHIVLNHREISKEYNVVLN